MHKPTTDSTNNDRSEDEGTRQDVQALDGKPSKPLTLCVCCGPDPKCDHDFQGWREFEDGCGGEQVCTKCGIGAMAHSLWLGM